MFLAFVYVLKGFYKTLMKNYEENLCENIIKVSK